MLLTTSSALAQMHKKATELQAWELTDHKGCTLFWEGGAKLLGEKDNVVTMLLSPGYSM
jgi:hypothetical protein